MSSDTTADAIRALFDAYGTDISWESFRDDVVALAEKQDAALAESNDDIGVIPPIMTDEMVMLSQPMYERQVEELEELEECKQRVDRLRLTVMEYRTLVVIGGAMSVRDPHRLCRIAEKLLRLGDLGDDEVTPDGGKDA